MSQCLIDQYSRFKVPEVNMLRINGELTLDENFPDNGGLLEAYTTFKNFAPRNPQTLPGLEKFSQEQLFFLGFANVSLLLFTYKIINHCLYVSNQRQKVKWVKCQFVRKKACIPNMHCTDFVRFVSYVQFL